MCEDVCFPVSVSLYYLLLILLILGRKPQLCYVCLIRVEWSLCNNSFSGYVLTVLIFSLYSHPFRLLCDTVAAYCLSREGSNQDHQELQKPRLE